MDNPRYLAAELLTKTFRSGSYSNIMLSNCLGSSDMSDRDKRLCSAIYYGVIQRKITLDHVIGGLCSRSIDKLDDSVLNILRCGIYQLLYMDSVPDSAAVNESVRLAAGFGKNSASGMINAVLREFIRRDKCFSVPMDFIHSSRIMYSAPEWLVDSLAADYGIEPMIDLLSNSVQKAPVTIRMNPTVCSEDELICSLGGISVQKDDKIPYCFEIGSGSAVNSEAFEKGYFHVQDRASQLCCMALNPTENDRVLDICAAPGGKTFTMAEMMNGKGELYAFDLHEKRVGLIRNGAERLHLKNIHAAAGDASVFNPDLPRFNKILCDVPCSGIGVIRRKPEIKYKDEADFEKLPEIQYRILENALNYLETGGELVYSTCTLRRRENDEVIGNLLENHPELEPMSFLTGLGEPFGSFTASIFPKHFGSDGFFISKVRKVR